MAATAKSKSRKSTASKRSSARKSASSKGGAAKRKTASSRGGAAAKKTSASRKQASGRSSSAGRNAAPSRRASSKSGSKSASGKGSKGRAGRADAVSLLKDDHERVDDMFKKFERMKEGDERKQALMQQIIEEVRVHAQVEEEIFYPAVREAFEAKDDDKGLDMIEEADVEHETVKWLIEQLESEGSDEDARDAKVKVMGEYIRHHVEEEEGELFKRARKAGVDFEALGQQIEARKRELMGEEPAGMAGSGDPMRAGEQSPVAFSRTTH